MGTSRCPVLVVVVAAIATVVGCNRLSPKVGGQQQALTDPGGGGAAPPRYQLKRPKDIKAAIFYYAWWHKTEADPPTCGSTVPNLWCCSWTGKGTPEPRPVLGLYGSDQRLPGSMQTVVDKHMEWIKAHSIDIVAVDWAGPGDDEVIKNYVIPAIEKHDLQWVLLYDSGIRLDVPPEGKPDAGIINFDRMTPDDDGKRPPRDVFMGDFKQFGDPNGPTPYFKHSKYLKFKNKPVVYMYISRAMKGTNANIKSAFDSIHASAQGFNGLYIVADHLEPGQTVYGTLKEMQASAVTSFHPIGLTNIPANATNPIKDWANVLKNQVFGPARISVPQHGRYDLMPGVFAQYDDTAVDPANCTLGKRTKRSYLLKDADDWRYMLREGGLRHAMVAEENFNGQVIRNTENDDSILWIYSFNEWGEGAGIEPLVARNPKYPFGFGDELLKVLKEVMDAGWVDPPGVPCQDMGPGWYEANEFQQCQQFCGGTACETKWDCNGEPCYSPATGLNYCMKCLSTPVCGDGFCALGKGEQCFTCPKDCPCDGYTCEQMGRGWYYPDQADTCAQACNEECTVKLDCNGKVCLAPHLKKAHCLLCPNLSRCGDGACQPARSENCETCPDDCGACVQPKTCGQMGPGWYEADQGPQCRDACQGDCLTKFDCDGVPCLSTSTGLKYCLKCPQLARCGDGACQRAIGESCSSCPNDCGNCENEDEDDNNGGGDTNSCGSQGFLTQDECNQQGNDCSQCQAKFDCGGKKCEGGYCLKCD